MRIRFSLRAFFILVTLFGILCYVWFVRPTQVAQRFADAIDIEDYQAADGLLLDSSQRFLAGWANEYWALKTHCELRPLTLRQLLTARRQLDVHVSYFELDYMVNRRDDFTATPFGMESGTPIELTASRILIDRASPFDRSVPRR